jgi:hypothetical protein
MGLFGRRGRSDGNGQAPIASRDDLARLGRSVYGGDGYTPPDPPTVSYCMPGADDRRALVGAHRLELNRTRQEEEHRMGNPEKGPGKLGHEGRGEGKPNERPSQQDLAKKLGKLAIRGPKK